MVVKKRHFVSEETKKKISNSLLGRIKSEEHRKNLSKSLSGRKFSDNHRRKISKANKIALMGRKLGEESKRKISNSLKGHKGVKYWLGKKKSKEHINKMVNTRIKNNSYGHSKETKEKISKLLKGKYIGEKSHCWKGGKSFEPYGVEFGKILKSKIKKRDNHICQECKVGENKLKYSLDIHHIDFNKKNNNENNLICLCRSCHSQTNYNRDDWTDYFQKKLNIMEEQNG